jgi:phosphodiesterase/alkaline phosphatase D-like protein
MSGPNDGASRLDQTTDAIKATTDTVRSTTKSVSDAIDAGLQPGAPLDRLVIWTRQAPLQALGAALLVGFMIGRRR